MTFPTNILALGQWDAVEWTPRYDGTYDVTYRLRSGASMTTVAKDWADVIQQGCITPNDARKSPPPPAEEPIPIDVMDGWGNVKPLRRPNRNRPVDSRRTLRTYELKPRTPAYVWGILAVLVLLALAWLFPVTMHN